MIENIISHILYTSITIIDIKILTMCKGADPNTRIARKCW